MLRVTRDLSPEAKGLPKRISAVIPSWNRADLLLSILSDLQRQTLPPDEIVVVDNGSEDETRAVVSSFDIQLISLPENRGFAPAVNAGIRRSTGDWVLILNNDLALPPEWLERLHGAADAHSAAFAVGKLLRHSDPTLIDGTWDLLSRGAHAWRSGYNRPNGPSWSQPGAISFAPMTAALFHRSVFERVGYLDETFEAYYEDVEFGLRCALAGLIGVYEPTATASHMSKSTLGGNSARVLFLTSRNQLLLLAKHYPPETLRKFAWPILVGQTLSLIGSAQQGHLFAALRGVIAAMRRWASIRDRPATPEMLERVLVQSERQIRELQQSEGFDPYWRLYFSLVRSG